MQQNNDEIPPLTPPEVLACIQHMDTTDAFHKDRDKALLAFLYLTGARISEIVKCADKDAPKKEVVHKATPEGRPARQKQAYKRAIIKSDIELYADGFDVHHVRTLKQRQKKMTTRTIPVIPTTQDELNIMQAFINYYNTIPNPEAPLFNITRQRAWKIINHRTGQFPHRLRHTAASQDSKLGFNNADLRKKYGWSDERTPGTYTKHNVEDLKEKYRNKRRY